MRQLAVPVFFGVVVVGFMLVFGPCEGAGPRSGYGVDGPGPRTAPLAEADRLGEEAATLHDRGDHDASAARYAQAARVAEAEGNADTALAYRAQSAVCLKKAGRVVEALPIMLAALAEARSTGQRRTEGLALGNLARLHDLTGQPQRGLAYRDELAAFAEQEGDTRLVVWTLEQAAESSRRLGDLDGARHRLERAIALDKALTGEDRRGGALLRQLANVLVDMGDDIGAALLWERVERTPAGLANEARHLSLMGAHSEAADLAWEAAQGFDAAGGLSEADRDRALVLWLSELLRAGRVDEADVRVAQILERASGGGEAPFLVLAGRVALTQGRSEDAARDLQMSLDAGAGWDAAALLSMALEQQGQHDRALDVAEDLPAGRARALMLGWLLSRGGASTKLADELLPELALERTDTIAPEDGARRLREMLPSDLPGLGFLALDVALGDAQRLRQAGHDAIADDAVRDGIRRALRWHAVEALERLPGVSVQDVFADGCQRVDDWVDGHLAPGRAVLTLLMGDDRSYLVICKAGKPATTFGLTPPVRLLTLVGSVLDQLRGGSVDAFAQAAWLYYEALVPSLAREDLADVTHVTFVLPDAFCAVPPSCLVVQEPRPDQPLVWFAYGQVAALLPHAFAGVAVAEPVAHDAPGVWQRIADPAVDRAALGRAGRELEASYGVSALSAGRPRATDGPLATGPKATATALRDAAGSVAVLELSVPALGGGRLTGLLLAPDPEALFEDEARGLVPWHRLADLALPPVVLLDRARFGFADPDHGPPYAATALMTAAREVLLTRWPSPVEPEIMLARIAAGLHAGLPLAEAVTGAQRDFLVLVRANRARQHPRVWGPWLAFAAP